MHELGRILMWWVVLSVWLGAMFALASIVIRSLTYSEREEAARREIARRELAEAHALDLIGRQLDEALAEHGEQ